MLVCMQCAHSICILALPPCAHVGPGQHHAGQGNAAGDMQPPDDADEGIADDEHPMAPHIACTPPADNAGSSGDYSGSGTTGGDSRVTGSGGMATASVSDDGGDVSDDHHDPSDVQGTAHETTDDTERDGEGEGDVEDDPLGVEFYADTGQLADDYDLGSEEEPELDEPLYPGCNYTLREVLFAFVQRKRAGQVRDKAFSDFMWLFRELLPTGNTLPTSWHMVKKLLGCRALSKFERHACVDCCMTWPHIAREDAIKHKDDRCTTCNKPRFHVREYGDTGKVRLTPQRAWWYFPAEDILQAWNYDREFVQFKRAAAEACDKHGYFASKEAERLQQYSNGTFLSPGNAYLEIGADAGQMFDKAQHSTVLIVLRCSGLPYTKKGLGRFCKPIILISGPREATNLQPFLQDLVDFFKAHMYGATPFFVKENRESGLVPTKETVWLTGCFGDTPMREKLALFLGHASPLGCGWCEFQGVWLNGATRFLGYSRLQRFELKTLTNRCGEAHYAWDDVLTLSDSQHCARASVAEVNKARHKSDQVLPRFIGCHGYSIFRSMLPYIDYANLFVLPLWHAMLYGLVKNFFETILEGSGVNAEWYVVTKEARDRMKAKEGLVRAVSEYTNTFESILGTKRSYFTMDQWLHFVLTWSTFVFGSKTDGILHADVYDAYVLLRDVVKHYCVVCDESEFTDARRNIARDKLRRLAVTLQKWVEQKNAPWKLMSFNLHILVCRLHKQEQARGHTAFDNELWIERSIHTLKEVTRCAARRQGMYHIYEAATCIQQA
jgi:hypothetical protein